MQGLNIVHLDCLIQSSVLDLVPETKEGKQMERMTSRRKKSEGGRVRERTRVGKITKDPIDAGRMNNRTSHTREQKRAPYAWRSLLY